MDGKSEDLTEQFVLDFEKALAADDYNRASGLMSSLWIDLHLMIVKKQQPDLKEVNFIKTPVTTPDGGSYMISFLHVDGPKIQLKGE